MICPDKQLDMWEYCDNSVILANADWYYTKQQTEELIDSVSGMNPTEVQDMINRSIHSKADKTYVDEQDAELSNSIRAINSNMAQRYTKTETNNLLDMKVDKSTYSAYTATTNEAINNKQDQLISGTNIRTINGESILGSGDLVIQGGGDITSGEVQTMIDEAVSGKQDTLIAGDNITIVNNVISSTASGDVTSAQVETMIATSISGKADTTAVTQDIATATADMATQTWVQNQGYLTEHQSLSAYSTTDEMNQAISAATDDMATQTWVGNQGYITGVDLSNYATLQDIPTSNSALTNDAGYITSAALNGYATEDYVTAATDDMATETWVNQQGFLTEHQSLSAYSTTQEMNEAISASTSGKVDTTAYTAYTAATDTALQGKQDTLTAGTNIVISGNVISAEGGNEVVELTQAEYDALVSGGTVDPTVFYVISDAEAVDMADYVKTSAFTQAMSGKQDTLIAGSGISIDSSNTIACTVEGKTYTAGNGISISTANSISLGVAITGVSTSSLMLNGSHSNNNKGFCTIAGANNEAKNTYEFVGGGRYSYSTSGSTSFGHSGNTLFSVGNGESVGYRHNAISLRQSGDLYVVDVDNTTYSDYYRKPMKRLQDYIQFKIVKLTQDAYDALVSGGTVDPNTIYYIVEQ